MKQKINPFSFSFLFSNITLTLITFPQHATSVQYSSLESSLINQTCTQCAAQSPVLNAAFCAAALSASPAASVTLRGLALLAVELALANATTTSLVLEQTLATAGVDPTAAVCLGDCLEVYSVGAAALGPAAAALLGRRYEEAAARVSGAMEAAETCGEGFREMGREVVPPQLGKWNYDFFQLCDIALCVAHLLRFAILDH